MLTASKMLKWMEDIKGTLIKRFYIVSITCCFGKPTNRKLFFGIHGESTKKLFALIVVHFCALYLIEGKWQYISYHFRKWHNKLRNSICNNLYNTFWEIYIKIVYLYNIFEQIYNLSYIQLFRKYKLVRTYIAIHTYTCICVIS